MKKFEFFGATRATRQRHSKTSSTGDEDVISHASGEPYTMEYCPFSIFEKSVSESEEMLTADRPRLHKYFT